MFVMFEIALLWSMPASGTQGKPVKPTANKLPQQRQKAPNPQNGSQNKANLTKRYEESSDKNLKHVVGLVAR